MLAGVSTEEHTSVAKDSPPSDGTESAEVVLASIEPMLLSEALKSSSIKSSGGDNSKSIGLRLRDKLSSFSDTC